jgi:hypothetical protein
LVCELRAPRIPNVEHHHANRSKPRRRRRRFHGREFERLRGDRGRHITSINMAKHSLTLDRVSSFVAPKGADLARFKVGENVSVAFAMRGGKMDATAIRPASPIWKNTDKRANLGG